jgi:hypothetical protein
MSPIKLELLKQEAPYLFSKLTQDVQLDLR